MSCGSGCAVKPLEHGYAVSACACRCWACPACAPRRRSDLRDEILSGHPTAWLTLTWNASRPEDQAQARRIMARAWKNLHDRIKRRWPAHAFEYCVIVEACKSGYPHFHVTLRAPYIPQGWLSDAWADLVAAPVVDIRAVRSEAALAGYLCKYLSKDPAKLGQGKRYWFSQGYRPPAEPDVRDARRVRPGYWTPDAIDKVVVMLTRERMIPVWQDPDHCLVMPLLHPPGLAARGPP